MDTLIVVDDPADWPLDQCGARVVRSRDYLTDPDFAAPNRCRVMNLCRAYRYQSTGYYVSLLAEARGQHPAPNVATIQDLKLPSLWRSGTQELDQLVQRSLHHLQSNSFILSIYFGRNLARCYDRLCQFLYRQYRVPLLQALFLRHEKDGRWLLQSLRPLAAADIPEAHREFVQERARTYFSSRPQRATSPRTMRYNLALLVNPEEAEPPSNAKALQRFERAARKLRIETERIGREDFGRLAEFDALLIRETTHVNHHTYRFARKAAAEGLVVIDDPESILRCTNKVYLTELLQRHRVPIPRTLVVHRNNRSQVQAAIGLPCILKQPDSAFSLGVHKVTTPAALEQGLKNLLSRSDLVLAQEYLPTSFDWRIGVLNGEPLYACRYYMAREHWQILRRDGAGNKADEGEADTLPLEQVPREVLRVALKAARLVGRGLYGVDLKQLGRRVVVIEVNDNPNIDAGVEDLVLKDELYHRILGEICTRIERRKQGFVR